MHLCRKTGTFILHDGEIFVSQKYHQVKNLALICNFANILKTSKIVGFPILTGYSGFESHQSQAQRNAWKGFI